MLQLLYAHTILFESMSERSPCVQLNIGQWIKYQCLSNGWAKARCWSRYCTEDLKSAHPLIPIDPFLQYVTHFNWLSSAMLWWTNPWNWSCNTCNKISYLYVYMYMYIETDESEATLLVDVTNAFNTINHLAALHNIRHLCPSIATTLINCYQNPINPLVNRDVILQVL